jgi:hypothetical protein
MILKAERLNTVHPDLAAVVRLAATYITEFDLLVVEGARTLAKQKEYVAKGASRTLNSKHLPGPDGYARAVDLAPLPVPLPVPAVNVATPSRRKQVGGNHYAKLDVQPWDVMRATMTPEEFQAFLRGNAIKYLMRDKGSRAEDFAKAHHYIETLLAEMHHA